MPKRNAKKSCGGLRRQQVPCSDGQSASNADESAACDLMVLLPQETSSQLETQLLIKEIMDRLASTGFTHIALTHTIYGRPRTAEDRADTALPESLWQSLSEMTANTGKLAAEEPPIKKRKSSNNKNPPIRVLRRLHAVIENLSDVGIYLTNGPHASLLQEYDLISISPRTEAAFQSACASATSADIITLDYTAGRGGLRLPFKIRPGDVKAVVERGAAFEIPFAPALLHGKQRKALVQTCRELQMTSLGFKPRILFSSGDRTMDESDVGAMALRTPGDLINLLQAVFQFDAKTSYAALGSSGIKVLKRARERRWGKSDVADVYVDNGTDSNLKATPLKPEKPAEQEDGQRKLEPASLLSANVSTENTVAGVEDGFITMN
jgi:ribonuclease P/MRP protein subunit RPP1